MDVTRATFFGVPTEDRPGALARFAHVMAEHQINLAGVWAFGLGRGNAEIIAIPRDPAAFRRAVTAAQLTARQGDCFHLTGEDRAGALAETLDRIAQEGINLHAVDAMGFGERFSAYVWCDERDVENLRQLLKGW